jgi:hypothetical protein
MAIIDTLKLAQALRDKGGFTPEAAEATAEVLNAAFDAAVATKADVEGVRIELEGDIKGLNGRLTFLQWQIGILAGLQVATLIKLFVH